jgi:hypothetical protein
MVIGLSFFQLLGSTGYTISAGGGNSTGGFSEAVPSLQYEDGVADWIPEGGQPFGQVRIEVFLKKMG